MINEILAKKIRIAREQANLSQEDLEKKLNAGKTVVSSWERGKRVPKNEIIEEIAKITGKDPLWFFVPEKSEHNEQTDEVLLNVIKTGNEELSKKLDTLLKKVKINNIASDQEIKEKKKLLVPKSPLPDNVIPFPAAISDNRPVELYRQPIGAGATIQDYHDKDIEGYFPLPNIPENRKVDAIFPVVGESMHPEIKDGAYILVKFTKEFKNWDKALVWLRETDELTVKYILEIPAKAGKPKKISLQGWKNHTRKSYIPGRVEVQGIVIGVINDPEEIKMVKEKITMRKDNIDN